MEYKLTLSPSAKPDVPPHDTDNSKIESPSREMPKARVPGSVQHQRRAGVRRTPVVSKGVSSLASVQSSMRDTRPEAIYSTSGHVGAAIPTTATVSTTRMLMPTFSSNQDNSVHIPYMLPWQPRPAIDSQPTVNNTQFVSQTGYVTINDYVQVPNRIESVHENLGINVTQSIKEKILKGEFIDLACLLNNSVNTGSDKQKLTWVQGEFILQPISQQSKITNIEK
ncbi:Hypothetical predicted protein [Mytilus galloprovincialis]|uniref:Uncharacterized protein n=1 Tax=Mytilus galloprovincialis TaxID=29158 RepID=A0A8B6FHX2_MYTGA|nr:Hypothetical predicted protein [Mytilus galloprovincialis]